MINIIEKNKWLWMFYSTVLRILGWILLCLGAIGFVMLLLESIQTGGNITFNGMLGTFKRSNHLFFNIGLVSLGLSQLLRYFYGSDNKMGPLLRYGDKIFYFYAILTVLKVTFWILIATANKMENIKPVFHNNADYITVYTSEPLDILHWCIFFLPTLLYQSTKMLIFIGLGKFVKYLTAVIKDSKQSSALKAAVQNNG